MKFDKAVEASIQEAFLRGDFDNLPGKGKPIDLTEYFNTPEDVRVAQPRHGDVAEPLPGVRPVHLGRIVERLGHPREGGQVDDHHRPGAPDHDQDHGRFVP